MSSNPLDLHVTQSCLRDDASGVSNEQALGSAATNMVIMVTSETQEERNDMVSNLTVPTPVSSTIVNPLVPSAQLSVGESIDAS